MGSKHFWWSIPIIFRPLKSQKLDRFMKKKSHSNVTFVTTSVLKMVTWLGRHLCMKKRSHSNVTFVITDVRERVRWTNSLIQFKKEKTIAMNKHVASGYEGKKPFKCDICDYRYPVKTKMKTYFALVHEGYKPFKLNTCQYTCSWKEECSIKNNFTPLWGHRMRCRYLHKSQPQLLT